MDENSNIIIPFLSEHFFYWIGFSFPTISVLIGWILYYGLDHNVKNGEIPTISKSFIKFPENRLFAVCMSIESCILGSIFYIRHKLISKMAKRYSQRKENSNSNHKTPVQLLNRICDVLAFAICFGLVGLSAITFEDCYFIHLSFSVIFWWSFLSYFIISDIAALRVHFPIRFLSLILPYFILFIVFSNFIIVIRCSPEESKKANNTIAIMQYIVAILLFLKILFIGYDNPPHDLVSSSSKTKVKLT